MSGNGNARTDLVKRALLEAAENYRVLLDHDRDLVQLLLIVQFRPDGTLKRTIVKPESHREAD